MYATTSDSSWSDMFTNSVDGIEELWPGMPHAVADRAIPIGRGERGRDASRAGGEIRRRPISNEGLVHQDAAAEVLGVAAVAADARLDKAFAASSRPRQRRRLQVDTTERIGGRTACLDALGPQLGRLVITQRERNWKAGLMRNPGLVVPAPGEEASHRGGPERKNDDETEHPRDDLQQRFHTV